MKLRHALTGAVYSKRADGLVEVQTEADRRGLFRINGEHVRGEVREADPHLLGWLAEETALPNRRTGAAAGAANSSGGAVPPAGVPLPKLGSAAANPDAKRSLGMELGLQGRNVLVTAASRGIGRAIAQAFADEGCAVAFCARGEEGLQAAQADLEGRGAKVFARALDVGQGDAFKQFVAQAAEELGGLDVYVANASGGAGPGEAAWQASFDVDVMGAVRGVEAALPALTNSDAGSVLFIGSTAALEYLGVPQAYNAMKAALIAHAGDLSQALAPKGVRVNCISPGPIYFEGGSWEMIKQAMPKMYEGALAQCAIGRMGAPEEVARAAVFLASPAASLITGANLVCDGGFTKRMPF